MHKKHYAKNVGVLLVEQLPEFLSTSNIGKFFISPFIILRMSQKYSHSNIRNFKNKYTQKINHI